MSIWNCLQRYRQAKFNSWVEEGSDSYWVEISRHYRGCDLLVIVNVDLPEDMEEVGVRDLVVLSDRLDSPARPSEVPYDVLQHCYWVASLHYRVFLPGTHPALHAPPPSSPPAAPGASCSPEVRLTCGVSQQLLPPLTQSLLPLPASTPLMFSTTVLIVISPSSLVSILSYMSLYSASRSSQGR